MAHRSTISRLSTPQHADDLFEPHEIYGVTKDTSRARGDRIECGILPHRVDRYGGRFPCLSIGIFDFVLHATRTRRSRFSTAPLRRQSFARRGWKNFWYCQGHVWPVRSVNPPACVCLSEGIRLRIYHHMSSGRSFSKTTIRTFRE